MTPSTGIQNYIGIGEAQVFKPYESPIDYQAKYRDEQQEAARKEQAKQKKLNDFYQSLEDISIKGHVNDRQELLAEKGGIQKRMTDKMVANSNYNPATDFEMQGEIRDLVYKNAVSEATEKHATETRGLINRDTKDKFTPESQMAVNNWYKMPLGDRAKAYKEFGTGPSLEPKPEVIDYEPLFKDGVKALGTGYFGKETKTASGETQLIESKRIPENKKTEFAEDLVMAGFNGSNPKAVKFVEDVARKLENEVPYQVASEEKKQLMLKEAALKEAKRKVDKYEDTSYKETLQGGGGSGFNLSFGDGNTAENDKVRIVVSDAPDRRVYDIATIKTSENSDLEFSRADGSVVKGTPLRVEKLKSGQSNVVVSVPEMKEDETSGKMVKVGEKEERVPYERNKGRIFQGKFGVTIEQIDKGIPAKGVEVKQGEAKKENTISLEEARKANPGMSDGDLIKSYAKYGYTVK